MHIAMSNALALMTWHVSNILHGDFTDSGSVWLLIGVILTVVAVFALAMEAALILDAPHRLRCRVRWPVDLTESTVTESPNRENLDGSGGPT
jgi:hypothetical protein